MLGVALPRSLSTTAAATTSPYCRGGGGCGEVRRLGGLFRGGRSKAGELEQNRQPQQPPPQQLSSRPPHLGVWRRKRDGLRHARVRQQRAVHLDGADLLAAAAAAREAGRRAGGELLSGIHKLMPASTHPSSEHGANHKP